MGATHAAAIAFIKMVFFCKNDIPIFIYIIIYAFYQISLFHILLKAPVVLYLFLFREKSLAKKISNNVFDYFLQYPTIRNAF